MIPQQFAERLMLARNPAGDRDDRTDSVMGAAYAARAMADGLLGIVAATSDDDPIHALAQGQLDALADYLVGCGAGGAAL